MGKGVYGWCRRLKLPVCRYGVRGRPSGYLAEPVGPVDSHGFRAGNKAVGTGADVDRGDGAGLDLGGEDGSEDGDVGCKTAGGDLTGGQVRDVRVRDDDGIGRAVEKAVANGTGRDFGGCQESADDGGGDGWGTVWAA